MHDKLPILGFRIGKLAYITDMKTIGDAELTYLKGAETLVVNGLRWERSHHSHQLIPEAIKFSKRIGAQRTYFNTPYTSSWFAIKKHNRDYLRCFSCL